MTQYQHDFTAPLVTHQGNALTVWGATGPVPGADGSFSGTAPWGPLRGVFATEGGRTAIRDGELTMAGVGGYSCVRKFTAVKQ